MRLLCPVLRVSPEFSRSCRLLVESTMTIGFVEPVCRPVGFEVSVALASRGATGMIKSGASVRPPSQGGKGKGPQVMALLI